MPKTPDNGWILDDSRLGKNKEMYEAAAQGVSLKEAKKRILENPLAKKEKKPN